MARISQKTILERDLGTYQYISSDFNKIEFDGSIRDKGYDVIHEKAYLCPCKSRESDHLSSCKNCGGTGWIFANPTKTKMIITGILADDKMKESALQGWGMIDTGSVKITAYNEDKLSYMDRIVVLDATAEHSQILYPELMDDGSQRFAYTKYDIKGVDFIGLFQDANSKLKRLVEGTDYLYRDNVITFDPDLYNSLKNPCVTIRYIHNPTYHVVDILRESITSTKDQGLTKLLLPIHAVGKRAHLIKDVENFDGDRLLDNSWKPTACEAPDMTKFQRQLRYTPSEEIFDNLSSKQKSEIYDLIVNDASYTVEIQSSPDYTPEYQSMLDAARDLGIQIPESAIENYALNHLFAQLKEHGFMQRMETGNVYGIGSVQFGMINMKDPMLFMHTSPDIGSLGYSRYGVKSSGNGNSYINTNYKVNEREGIESQFTRIVYVSENSSELGGSVYGARAGLAPNISHIRLVPLAGGGTIGNRLSYNNESQSFQNFTHKGLYIHTVNGTVESVYKDYDGIGGVKSTRSIVPVAPGLSTSEFLLAYNGHTGNGLLPESHYTKYVSCFFRFSNAWTDDDAILFRSIWNSFIAVLGI